MSETYLSQKRHFEDASPGQSPKEHFFEQLNLDLEWGLGAAYDFTFHQGQHPITAVFNGINAIAGRRYHRQKLAEKDGDLDREDEMRELARFWYELENKLRQILER
jgi:hypothetical protein